MLFLLNNQCINECSMLCNLYFFFDIAIFIVGIIIPIFLIIMGIIAFIKEYTKSSKGKEMFSESLKILLRYVKKAIVLFVVVMLISNIIIFLLSIHDSNIDDLPNCFNEYQRQNK